MSETQTVRVSPIREQVAEEVRVLLARRKISASELARRMGVTQPYISRRLNAETAMDLDDLALIATVLGVEVADLLPNRPNEGRTVVTAGDPGRITASTSGGADSHGQINVRKAQVPGRPRPVGGPANPVPRQATRRPARLPQVMTGS